jgi:hypothetical protein
MALRGLEGGLFIASTSKEPLGESFTEQVQWISLETSLRPDKSDRPD